MTILGFGQGAMGSATRFSPCWMSSPSTAARPVASSRLASVSPAIGIAMITAAFFWCQRSYGPEKGWYDAVYLAYVLILAFLAIALLLAVMFWREGRKRR